MRVLKWTAATFAIFIAALAVFLFAFDWNLLRSYIGEKVTAQTGREFSIAGDLDVRLALPPRIHAEQVRLENADWGTEPRMLDLASVDFTIRLLPLLRGEIVLPEVAFSRPVIVLEKNARGEGNWELSKKDKEDEETDFPKIGRLVVDEGTITYR
ncbi:MAG: AsmA family protein, partial [Burkholderiales bacterium]